MKPPPLTLFYDGLCPLCSREIAHYRQHLPASTRYVDISAADFAAADHGLDPQAVQRAMHVKVGADVRAGVDAFVALYDAMPRYRGLARLARAPLFRMLIQVGYAAFARVRHCLPRRRHACVADRCQLRC